MIFRRVDSQKSSDFQNVAEEILHTKGRALHWKLLWMITGFAVLYTIINLLLDLPRHAIVTASVSVGAGIAGVLYRLGYYYWSRVWNFVQINVAVFFLASFSAQDTYLFLFYFPLIIGTMIVFQGEHRKTGIFLVAVSFLCMMLLTLPDIFPNLALPIENSNSVVERFVNVAGVGVILIFEIAFLIRLNKEIQSELLLRKEQLEVTNDKLEETLYVRERMMSVLAHDIRTPLATIHAYVNDLASTVLSEQGRAELLELLGRKTAQTEKLLNDVVKWYGSQQQILAMKYEEISLAEIRHIILDTVEIMSRQSSPRSFKIEVPEEQTISVQADRVMLESILRNLISNAVKFTRSGGAILVKVVCVADGFEFAVIDDGRGISAGDLEKLKAGIAFSRSEQGSGAGLGNYIVMEFLRRHGSFLNIESKVNEGSTFRFKLPAYPSEVAVSEVHT